MNSIDFDKLIAGLGEAMGIRFFNEQKIPAFFQYADISGESLGSRRNPQGGGLYGSKVAKEGRKRGIADVRDHGGSPIAYSAIRYAVKAREAAVEKAADEPGGEDGRVVIPIGEHPGDFYVLSPGFDELVMPWQDEIRMNANKNNL